MQTTAHAILEIVRRMDDEATTLIQGQHCGLCNYGTHHGSKHLERSWSAGLAERLTEAGCPASTEVAYPGERKKCDVVATLPDGSWFWIEVKATWRTWFSSNGQLKWNNRSLYRGYLFGPLEPGLARSHSVSQDVDKLEMLSAADASAVGLVVIGFDAPDGAMEQDVEELIRRKTMRERGWRIEGPRSWPDRNSDQCFIRCWCFWRELH